MDRREKTITFVLGSIFSALILVSVITAGITSSSPRAVLILQPKSQMEVGDCVYHGIFDEYQVGSEILSEFKAVIKSEVISNASLGLDGDGLSDLTLLSSMIFGQTDAGEISVPSYMDIYLANSILNLVNLPTQIALLPPYADVNVAVPPINAMHFVTSTGYSTFEKILDIMHENGFAYTPDLSNEIQALGEYPNYLFPEDGDGDIIDDQGTINYVKIGNSTNSFNARNNDMTWSSNKTGFGENIIDFKIVEDNADSSLTGRSGPLASFWIKIDDLSRSNIFMYFGSSACGIGLKINTDGSMEYMTGDYYYTAGDWYAYDPHPDDYWSVGMTLDEDTWYKIDLGYDLGDPGYTHNPYTFRLWINKLWSWNVLSWPYEEYYYDMPLAVFNPPSLSDPWETFFFANTAEEASQPSVIHLDDFTFFSYDLKGDSTSIISDISTTLLNLLSFYHMAVLPSNFNYQVLFDIFSGVNRFSYEMPVFKITNNIREFRVVVNETAFYSFSESLLEVILGLDYNTLTMGSWESRIGVNMTLCWDKRIDALNDSSMVVYYKDLDMTRRTGLKLVATTLGGYPVSPAMTEYAAIFESIDEQIESARNLAIGMSITVSLAAMAGAVFINYAIKKR